MNRAALALLAFLLPWFALALAQEQPAGERDTPSVLLLEIEGAIGPATSDYLVRGIERAEDQGAVAVVLRIDTPGGLVAATRDIDRAILGSRVPVIGFVAPEGARAASAGTYIMYATHLAAMAPATSIGAATPVALGPGGGTPSPPGGDGDDGDPEADKDSQDEDNNGTPGSAPERKALNDAIATLKALAERRGRSVEFAEAAVRDAATLTASEALDQGVIEIVASDLADLLAQADGRVVDLGDGPVTLATAGAAIERVTPDWRNSLLSVITDPTVAYLLLLIGIYGLLFEGYSPGAIVPGVVGAICLLLALYALQVLPVNYAGVALIALGAILIGAELLVPSFGALGIGGVIALVAGSLLLFDETATGLAVPTGLIVGIGAASGVAFFGVLWLALRARSRPGVAGIDEMLHAEAVALDDFDGHGRVRARGEVWQAESTAAVRRGQLLRVIAVDGLVLRVAPAAPATSPTHPSGEAP